MEELCIQSCEDILRKKMKYNTEHEVLLSETAVAERLLARKREMRHAYRKLHEKLGSSPAALEVFLGQLLSVAAFWNPEQLSEERSKKKSLEEINESISKKASEICDLYNRRDAIESASMFGSDAHYSIVEVIIEAARENHLFNSYMKKDIETLSGRFDQKYWPSFEDFFQEISRDASAAKVTSHNSITCASTSSRRSSRADFLRALREAIVECSVSNNGQIPDDFRLTDNALATLTNCALDLPPNKLVDREYIKRWRQRDREKE